MYNVNMLTNIISKIIYLPNVDISQKVSQSCIEQGKLFNVNIIPFKGVHGHDVEKYMSDFQIKPKYFFKGGRRGVLGCFFSHYLLWLQCVKENKPYLILEHDGYFIRDLPINILDTFDDVLKLDNEDPYDIDYTKNLKSDKNIEVREYFNDKTKNLDLNETGNYMRGAYSYIIKPKAAKKIIKWIEKNGFLPADIQLGNKIVNIKVTVPTVVRLHPIYETRVEQLSLTRTII